MRSQDVDRVFREGQPLHGERVVLFLAPGAGDAAFIASRRVGGAVERNRARRILRAAWREVSGQVRGTSDAILVAREAIRGARTPDVVREMTELLERGEESRP